ncbi:hypothetical protein AB6A40_008758 [Gnathostoma spinigerum]|uniref:CBS domain-containing protein n=1 Tax=Gnathostoma spinigerum TaxID=75299 RepID=A0ABD6EPZ5_9BILA
MVSLLKVSSEANCSSLIQLFVDGRVSCVLVRDETGELIGSVSKQDVMNELAKHATNYLEILTIEVKDICRPANFALPSSTVFEVIGLLLASEQQCIFVVDIVSGQPVAAIAFIDIMEYLLSSSDNKNFFT